MSGRRRTTATQELGNLVIRRNFVDSFWLAAALTTGRLMPFEYLLVDTGVALRRCIRSRSSTYTS